MTTTTTGTTTRSVDVVDATGAVTGAAELPGDVFDIERERLELHRTDGEDLIHPIAPGEGAYDGTLPVTRFLEICAGQPVGNDADGVNGAMVVATLAAMYRSAQSRQQERVQL